LFLPFVIQKVQVLYSTHYTEKVPIMLLVSWKKVNAKIDELVKIHTYKTQYGENGLVKVDTS